MDKEENKKMKVAIIVPYFGKLPNYFQVFLDSCSYNSGFDWIIFTNDSTNYKYPTNVHPITMTFEECRAIVQDHFDFVVSLSSPQKLCDYKCAYGYIFQAYLAGFDWWGYCDLDQIFGNLGAFITEEMLKKYDKIGSLGHLTLYRNTSGNNLMFLSDLNGRPRYREVFTTERGCAFDEWLPDNINEIYLESGRPVMLDSIGADVNAYRTTFQLFDLDVQNRCYIQSTIKNSVFLWNNGQLTQIYMENNVLQQREFPYVHLQKRQMKDCRTDKNADCFYIVPNRLVDGKADVKQLIRNSRYKGIVNIQYFKVKWKSLKYRLKSGNWKFDNIF
ncbi:DUF6625 family protein [Butyricicoccus porcorum]|uniref:DUF6625 family protein n=1 Tax=Butyricicoccus porcorum TaxID=1945634 RepID=UPI003F4A981E